MCELATLASDELDSCLKRIENAYEAIQKLGVTMSTEISREYFDLKIRELRERQREEAALQKELAEAQLKLEKERAHYENALSAAQNQLSQATGAERDALSAKVAELEGQLADANQNLAGLDYREANQRAGYVYVISNIGSFGEDVYKIGMTRRLNPPPVLTY